MLAYDTTMSDIPHPVLSPVTRMVILLLLLSPLVLAIPQLAGWFDGPVGRPASDGTPGAVAQEAPVPSVRALPDPLTGFALNAHHISDLPRYLEGVDRIAELGANSLLVVTPMYQKHATSTTIRHRPKLCPTESQLVRILERGRQRGLFTVLMPIVLIEKPEGKEWRGVIEPHDWDEWWKSYERFLDHYVEIARAADVDMLVVGSELNSTEDQLERWDDLIASVRNRFGGHLSYSANWDRFDKVKLWPKVDVMSVSSYFELERESPGAPESDLVAAWQPIQRRLASAADRWERPLLLIEVGYPSLPWANAHPWNYVAEHGTRADHESQARCWRAFFGAWNDLLTDPDGSVLGVCGYRWDPYHAGDEYDTGYGIVGKPAYDVIRSGFAELRGPAGE